MAKPERKIKAGDRVRFKCNWCGTVVDTKIKSVDSTILFPYNVENISSCCGQGCYGDNEFVCFLDEPTQKYKFKVGDLVRVHCDLGCSGVFETTIARLRDREPAESTYPYKMADNCPECGDNTFREESLTLLPEPEKSTDTIGADLGRLICDAVTRPPSMFELLRATTKTPTLSTTKNTMRNLSLLAKKLLDADTKALIKAGMLDENLNIADRDLILSVLVEKYKKELAVEARKIVREAKKQEEE